MDNIYRINEFIKILFISMYMFFAYIKIVNYQKIDLYKRIIIILSCFFISTIYIFLISFIDPVVVILFLYFIYDIVLSFITDNKLIYSTLVMVISFTIVYSTYIFSVVVAGITIYIFKLNIYDNDPIINLIINLIEIIILFNILRLKRIRNGLDFLKKSNKIANLIIYIGFFGGVILTVFGLLKGSEDVLLNTFLITGTLLIFISLLIWTQNQITKQYKRNMKDRTIEIQKKEIDEQSKIIEEIKEENLKFAKVIHKYNSRLAALELGIKNTIEKNSKSEFADELGILYTETQEISKSFSEETTINKNKLPLTNIFGIDNIFRYFEKEANKNDINFRLLTNNDIKPLLEIIDKAKLETLIGDHLKDAIIAVNESKSSNKSILAILGIAENCYEFSVCDTGIEFEIDTLLKLGLEQTTTHKEDGGSGIGFITTFETLKETKASLIIEEYNPKTTNYTKSITIRFDGKEEFRIYSYRAEEIKKKNKTKRIIIEEL